MREWKELLFSGLPLYEPVKDRQPGFGFREPLDTIELQKQEILNNQDYDEYTVSLKYECSVSNIFCMHICLPLANFC